MQSYLLAMLSEIQSIDRCMLQDASTHSLTSALLTSRTFLVVQTLPLPHGCFYCTRAGPTTADTPPTERLRPPTVTCEENCLGSKDRKLLHLPGLHTSDC